MHATTSCRIVFSATSDRLESAVDYLEKLQRGEYFFDDEEDTLVLIIEEDWELSSKDKIIAFIDRLYKKFKKKIDIHVIGTMSSVSSDACQKFECQCNNRFFRYRDSDWTDFEIDESLSYEEFEEESGMEMDEDEYGEYVHRAHKGIKGDDGDIYGDWDYID